MTPEKTEASELYKKTNKNAGERQVRDKDPYYSISGAPNQSSVLRCKACASLNEASVFRNQVYYVIKSNQAVYEELDRISSYLKAPGSTCPNSDCTSNTEGIPHRIIKRGKTPKGNQRYKCKLCGYSFTGKPFIRKHERTEIDKYFFKQLVSRAPLRRISFTLDMSMGMIYRRINLLHQQCLAFIAEREKRLINEKKYDRLYLCTDRQVQKSNWTNRKEKMNCEFYGIGTADLQSGYVLAFNFNYDPSLNPIEVEELAAVANDNEQLKHNRKYARLWLKTDFNQAKTAQKIRHDPSDETEIVESIRLKSSHDLEYDIDKSSEYFDRTNKLPNKGMEVHNEYTMAAHFFLIKQLTQGAEKTRFYLDQDSGMKNWYVAAFKEEIAEGSSGGFILTMEKEMTVDSKRSAMNEC